MTKSEFIKNWKRVNPDYTDVDDDIIWTKLNERPEEKAKIAEYNIEPDPIEYHTERFQAIQPNPEIAESTNVTNVLASKERPEEKEEGILGEKWRLWQTGWLKLASNIAQYTDAIISRPSPMDKIFMEKLPEGEREIYTENLKNNIFSKSARDFHDLVEYTLETNQGLQEPENFERLGWGTFYKPNVIANTIVEAMPSLISAVAGGAYAGLPGVFGATLGMEGATAYDTAIDAGETPEKAQKVSAMVGLTNALISTARFKPIIDALPGGKDMATQMLTKNFVEKGVLKQASAEMGKQALYEAIEETTQEWTHMIGESFTAKGIPTHSEAINRTLTSFYAGGVAGAPLGGITGISQHREATKRKDFNKKFSAQINAITPDRISYDIASNSVTINYENITEEERQAMQDSGLEDRLKVPNLIKNYPDIPIEMAVMVELNKNSEYLGDVEFEFDDTDNVALYTAKQLIDMGYDDYATRFETSLLKKGDPEYEPRRKQYRLQDTGYNETQADGSGRIVLRRGANANTIVEEQVEQIYKRIAETDPELRQAIDDYLDNVRVVFESNGYTPPKNTDFFSKIMTFNVLGYAERDIEMATMATLPQPIIDSFLEIMGRQTDGTNLAFLYSRKKPSKSILPTESVVTDKDVQSQLDSEPDSDRAPPTLDPRNYQLTSTGHKKLYHVALNKNLKSIMENGLLPFQDPIWEHPDGRRQGHGEVYAFENLEDAKKWVLKTKFDLGEDATVLEVDNVDDVWEQDIDSVTGFPKNMVYNMDGDWLRRPNAIDPSNLRIIDDKSFQLTSAQKEYFKDTKVINEDGTPQVMYHGTTKSFDEFKKTKPSSVFFFTPDPNQAGQFTLPRTSKGKILIDEPALPGANIMPVYINATNLFDYESPKDVKKLISEIDKYPLYGKMRNGFGIDSIKDIITGGNWWAIEKYKTAIKRLGFDGFYIKENIYNDSERNLINDSESSVKSLAVFNSEQIKSVFNSNPKVGDKSFQLTATEEAPTLDRKLRTHEDLETLIPEEDRITGDYETGEQIKHVSGKNFKELDLDATEHSPTVSQNDLTAIWNQALEESNLTIDDIPEGMNPNTDDFWNDSFKLADQARYWYEISAETVKDTFPDMDDDEIYRILKLIGATSIQANPIMNVERTLSTLSEDERGVPVETGLASPKPVRQALFGGELAGLKTGNFSDTFGFLLGVVDKVPLSTNDRQVASTFSIDGMEFGSDPRLYEAVSKFYMILRDFANSKIPADADPFQTWQLQALGWVQERINKGNESFDDLTIAFDQVLQKLVDNGVPLSKNAEGNYIVTKDDLKNPKITETLSPTAMRAQEAQIATVEAGTTLTEEGARADRIITEINNQLTKEQKPHITARLNKALGIYKSIQYRALKAIGQRKKNAGNRSLVDEILTVITGEKVSLSRIESGQGVFGTYAGDANPNLRIPMRTGLGEKSRVLTETEISQFLAFMGKHLKQRAMASSKFTLTEEDGDTKSIFIQTEQPVTEADAVYINKQLNESGLDYSLNIHQVPNGTVIDINPAFSDEGTVAPDTEIIEEILFETFGTENAKYYNNSYESSYIEEEDYDSTIRRINEQTARRLHTPFRENSKRGQRVLLSTIRGKKEIEEGPQTYGKALHSRIEKTRDRYRTSVSNLKRTKEKLQKVEKGVKTQTDTQNNKTAPLLKQLTGKTFQLTGEVDTQSTLFDKPPVKKSNTSPPGWWAEHVIPISTRLGNISESIKNRLRQFEFAYLTHTNSQRERVRPFVEKFVALPNQVRADLDIALKNGVETEINRIVSENNMYQEYREVRAVLDDIYFRANEAGFDVGFLEGYFPRRVTDLEGLLDSLDKEMQGVYDRVIADKQRELGRELELSERSQIINNIISRGGSTEVGTTPGATQSRTITTLTPDLNQFYADSESSLMGYIDSMNEAIAVSNFFGRGEFKLDSIGVYVDQLVRNGELNRSDQRDLTNILRARFNRNPNREWVAPTKNLIYAMTMGSVTSTITQIGDTAWAIYRAGVHAPKAMGMAIAGKSMISREDIGIDKIGAEFEQALAKGFTAQTSKWLRFQFKILGLSWLDGIGKETLINGAIMKYQKLARKSKPNSKFIKDMERVFGIRANDVIAQLKSGEITEDVKFLAFNTLSDFQPVTLSELPQGYAENIGGRKRMFYQLKTFTIKQLDVFRNEAISKINKGYKNKDKELIKEGFGNLGRLALIFVLCNGGVGDNLKDLYMGRPIHLDDWVWSNLWRLFGLSRYNFYKIGEDPVQGVAETLMNTPVSGILLDLTRDAKSLHRSATDDDKPESRQKDFMTELKNIRSVNRIPFFGKNYYWWFGGGRRKILKNELARYKEISRERLLTPSEIEEYGRYADEAEVRGEITLKQYNKHIDRANGAELMEEE